MRGDTQFECLTLASKLKLNYLTETTPKLKSSIGKNFSLKLSSQGEATLIVCFVFFCQSFPPPSPHRPQLILLQWGFEFISFHTTAEKELCTTFEIAKTKNSGWPFYSHLRCVRAILSYEVTWWLATICSFTLHINGHQWVWNGISE